jgi:hypothetical protein
MTNINGYLNMTFVSRFQPPKAMFSARCYEILKPCMTWQFQGKGEKFLTLTLNQGKSNTANKDCRFLLSVSNNKVVDRMT